MYQLRTKRGYELSAVVSAMQKAIRRGRWKYIKDRRLELLFDLDQDVGERRNLAFQFPGIEEALRTALAGWEAPMPALK